MLESMEGRRGMPRLKPPFPSQVGYLGRPTLINNVETLAHVPAILRMGGEAWAALGVRGASGVRLWSVTGAVAQPGCYEAPNGSTLRELDRRLRGRRDGRDRRDRPRRRGERDPPAGRARRAAHARRAARVGRRGRLGRRAGLPGELSPAAPARRDDALLRRGVVPEMHAVPDRQPRHPPRRSRSSSTVASRCRAGRSRSGSTRW